jgi:cytochrome c-type biogenesis protein CcmE
MALTILAITASAALSGANTILKVSSLLGDPESYQFEMVRVSGIVSNHRIRYWGARTCFQLFTVKDGTGSIRVQHKVNCVGAKNSLRNRDLVTLEGRFEWTSGKRGLLRVKAILAKVAPSAQ